jgi:hypothetical protein
VKEMTRFRGEGAVRPWVAAGLVVLALLACKKKGEEALPDVSVPEAGTVEEAAAPTPSPAPTDTAAPTSTTAPQPITRPVDGGVARTDAGTHDAGAVDAGSAARDAGAAAPVDAGRPPDLVACSQACQRHLTDCLARVAEGGTNVGCTAALQGCMAACRQH